MSIYKVNWHYAKLEHVHFRSNLPLNSDEMEDYAIKMLQRYSNCIIGKVFVNETVVFRDIKVISGKNGTTSL